MDAFSPAHSLLLLLANMAAVAPLRCPNYAMCLEEVLPGETHCAGCDPEYGLLRLGTLSRVLKTHPDTISNPRITRSAAHKKWLMKTGKDLTGYLNQPCAMCEDPAANKLHVRFPDCIHSNCLACIKMRIRFDTIPMLLEGVLSWLAIDYECPEKDCTKSSQSLLCGCDAHRSKVAQMIKDDCMHVVSQTYERMNQLELDVGDTLDFVCRECGVWHEDTTMLGAAVRYAVGYARVQEKQEEAHKYVKDIVLKHVLKPYQ
jgi:hypothetical protein